MAAKKVIPIKQISAWSFSRYSTYKLCPLKAKISYIDKIQEPPNQAMSRGALIHNFAEDYIKGKVTKLAPELVQIKGELKQLRAMFKKNSESMVVEDQWAFTKTWGESAWNDWLGCWLRIKLDCAHHEQPTSMIITDWKTGKYYAGQNDDYVEQLELYALAALLMHEHIDTVKPRLVYTDLGRIYPNGADEPELIYTRGDIPKLKKLWEKRVKPMLNDKIFAPRPNDKCKWCFYGQSGKSKGGPGTCKY